MTSCSIMLHSTFSYQLVVQLIECVQLTDLGTFEYPLALSVEVIISPQCLVQYTGTDTQLPGIQLCKMTHPGQINKIDKVKRH